jgi:ribose 1,5-bisphosphokinase PhnN
MKKAKEPVVVPNNGKAAVAQGTDGYQSLLDIKERFETIEVLRLRLASNGRKECRTADEFFSEFFASNSISPEN